MRSRALAVAAVAVALPLGLAACGSNVTKADLSNKLKSDPQFKVLNDKQRDCIADLMMKKGNKGDLRQWVDGKKKIEEVRGDSSGIQGDAMKCATAG